jgi:hypothetical protein
MLAPVRIAINLFALLAVGCLVACSDDSSPEAQVRKTLAAIEAAAEARDVGGVMEYVSEQFRDASGRDGRELAQYVRGYFIANQSIHLLTRIENIEFPTRTEARAKVTVGMVGREAAEADAWNLAAEVRDFDVTFMSEDGEWKITHAQWGQPGLN